jgi:hypothetical protein
MMMLLNQSIKSLVTAAIVEGLSDRGSDKEADATEKRLQQLKVAPVAAETAAQQTAAWLLKQRLQQLKNKTIFKFQYLNSKFRKKLET